MARGARHPAVRDAAPRRRGIAHRALPPLSRTRRAEGAVRLPRARRDLHGRRRRLRDRRQHVVQSGRLPPAVADARLVPHAPRTLRPPRVPHHRDARLPRRALHRGERQRRLRDHVHTRAVAQGLRARIDPSRVLRPAGLVRHQQFEHARDVGALALREHAEHHRRHPELRATGRVVPAPRPRERRERERHPRRRPRNDLRPPARLPVPRSGAGVPLARRARDPRVFTTKGNASQADVVADAHNVDNRYRLNAIATGQPVVFQYIADTILESAVKSLAVALLATALFLLLCFRVFSDYTTLGLVNLFPIVVTVALLAGAMRYLGIPLNALTATVLSISIGLGVDYSSHIVHRFGDEYEERDLYDAIDVAVRGTGGALTGSMLTTVAGIGVLVLAITPILGDFGSVTALSIFISYVLSVVVTPSAMAVWGHAVERYGSA
nr:MMPL family transporter [Halarchaeum acidiphilum]